MQTYIKQECIPVGCVPPASVAIGGGLHQAPPQDQAPSPEQAHPLDQAPPRTWHPVEPGTPTWDQADTHL